MKGLADSLTTRGRPLAGWDANKGIKIFLCPLDSVASPLK